MVTTETAGARHSRASRVAFLVVHGLIAGPWVAGLALAAIGAGGLVTGATTDPRGWVASLSTTIGVVSFVPLVALGVGFRRWWRGAPLVIVLVDGGLGLAALVGGTWNVTANPAGDIGAPLLYALVAGVGAGLAAMIKP